MKHWFNDAVQIYDQSGKDEFGRISWGDGVSTVGRFVEEDNILYNPQSEQMVTDAVLYLHKDEDVSLESKISYGGTDYQVVKVAKPKDMNNVRFIKLYLRLYG
jgi:hypothetical protein